MLKGERKGKAKRIFPADVERGCHLAGKTTHAELLMLFTRFCVNRNFLRGYMADALAIKQNKTES